MLAPDEPAQPEKFADAAVRTPRRGAAANAGLARLCTVLLDGFLTLIAAQLFVNLYFRLDVVYGKAKILDLVHFQAARPFQLRVLMPLVVRCLTHLGMDLGAAQIAPLVLFTAASIWAFRHLLGYFFSSHIAYPWSFFLVLAFVWNNCLANNFFYLWDIPAVFFFTLGLSLLLEKKMAFFYPLFFIALLNRETAAILVAAYAFLRWRQEDRKVYAAHLLTMTGLVLAVRYALSWAFRNNPGEGVEWHLAYNLHYLAHSLGPNLNRHLVLFGGCWLPAWLFFSSKPPELRRLLWIAVPFFACMLLAADLDETRVYGELIPLFLTSALCTMLDLIPNVGPRSVHMLDG